MQAGEELLAGGFRIGALQGASTAEIQKLLSRFAERRSREGLRVAGHDRRAGCGPGLHLWRARA